MDLKIIVIVGKGSNTQKILKKQIFYGTWRIFLKNSKQFNCSGQTRDLWTTITKKQTNKKNKQVWMSGSINHFSHHHHPSHYSHQPQRSPDPNHLITDHQHLSRLIKFPLSLHSPHCLFIWSTVCCALLSLTTYLVTYLCLLTLRYSYTPPPLRSSGSPARDDHLLPPAKRLETVKSQYDSPIDCCFSSGCASCQ